MSSNVADRWHIVKWGRTADAAACPQSRPLTLVTVRDGGAPLESPRAHTRSCECRCSNVAGVLCPKISCDRWEVLSAHSNFCMSNNLIRTVLVARQHSGGQITRARRNYIHIRTQARPRARAVKTQPDCYAPVYTPIQGCECIIIMLFFDPNSRRQLSEAWIF